MIPYTNLSKEELQNEFGLVCAEMERAKSLGLRLDISRGKPGVEQLALSSDLLSVLQSSEDCFDGTIDARNYGSLSGLPSAKLFFADLLGTKPEQVFVGGRPML